jgi:protein gp37
MASKSSIEWTEMTWNPVTGCTKVSQGCKNCYAERMARRLKAMGVERYRNQFDLTMHPDLVDQPRQWLKPRLVFVNSMSDLFHEDVDFEFIQRVFETMRDCPQHTFQILTKRSLRLRQLSRSLIWPPNVWMGVSVENDSVIHRVHDLQKVACEIRFLSCEPLLGPLEDLPLDGIDWVIVGGESGPGARPVESDWIRGIRSQCRRSNTPFFFKQWGGVWKKRNGRELDGLTYDEMPHVFKNRAQMQAA